MLKAFLVFITLTASSHFTWAANGQPGFSLTSSFMFLNQDRDSDARGDFKDNDLFLDIKTGYALLNGLYFGAVYSTFQDSDEERKAYGPSLGYQYSGFYFGLSYLLAAEHRIVTESQTLKGGNGFVVEASYNYPLFSFLTVGGNLSYMSFSYSETESFTGTTTSIGTHQESFLLPMLQISFFFNGGSGGGISSGYDSL